MLSMVAPWAALHVCQKMKAAAAASTPIPARTEMTLWPKPVKKLTHKCRESRDLSAGTSRMAANEAMRNRPGKSITISCSPEVASCLALNASLAPLCGLMKRAFAEAEMDEFAGTDEASLLERAGIEVAVVAGSARNFKITQPGDIELAEFYLSKA